MRGNFFFFILPAVFIFICFSCEKDNLGQSNISNQTDTLVKPNIPPVAIAGVDTAVDLPRSLYNPVYLDGTGSSDSDGKIVSYEWKKISGPAFYRMDEKQSKTALSYLIPGDYKFRLKVKDNKLFFINRFFTDMLQTFIDIYDVPTGTWSIAKLNQSLFKSTLVSTGDKIYVAGGEGELAHKLWTIEF